MGHALMREDIHVHEKKDSENINIKLSFAVFVLPSLRAVHPQKLEVYRDIMNITSQKKTKIIILKKQILT